MGDPPPILVLDDGELLRVQRLLQQLGLPFRRIQGPDIGPVVPCPSRLLVASGRRTLEPPRFESPSGEALEPVRVCIHGQDFLPLRKRLRELGVHFLVQGALDQQSLAVLLLQLLHHGPERRSERRLPLGGLIHVRSGRAMLRARLVELSVTACCFRSERPFAAGSELTLLLPASLGGGDELSLTARVARCDADRSGHRVVTQLEELDTRAREQLEALAAGALIGARVTPLLDAPRPSSATGGPAATPTRTEGDPATAGAPGPRERRKAPRAAREGRVQVLAGAEVPSDLVLTRDLSRGGARIAGLEAAPGTRLTLALYGAAREEPLVVSGRVVRDDGEGGLAVAFDPLGDPQARQIDRLCGARARVEAVDPATGATHRVNVARVRLREAEG